MWLAKRVNGRVHSTTGAVPAERLDTERQFLSPLPPRRFDTAYRDPRRVHLALPLIEWDGVRYSVPPGCVGQMVALPGGGGLRRAPGHLGWTDGRHPRARRAPHDDVWDPAHRQAAEAAALGRTRAPLHVVDRPLDPRPATPFADYDVETPDLGARYGAVGGMA